MGNKISFPKSNLILHYYIFQKTIHKYLKDWKDKKDGEYIQKGYIFHPNWIKEWKRIIKYEDLKTNFIKHPSFLHAVPIFYILRIRKSILF